MKTRGYLIVLFTVIIAFVGVVAAMQVLILTSVATTSRAYDHYRQSATEMVRLQRAVAEALLDQRQVGVLSDTRPLSQAIAQRLTDISAGGATITANAMPETLPSMMFFPSSSAPIDPPVAVPPDVRSLFSPELALLVGPVAAVSPELRFDFASQRKVLEIDRTYRTRVTARLVAVPLTRFDIAAYDLPAEIGATTGSPSSGPAASLPSGLVPARDPAFVSSLQAQPGVLPYHYRRRAALAAAYQYLFSQRFIDRVAEYAGITHFHNLDAGSATATLAGMTVNGNVTNWDIGTAGSGTYGSITTTRDAAVIFAETAGKTLRLYDSVGAPGTPLFLLILGPADPAEGSLVLELSTIERPLVVVCCNVHVSSGAGTAVQGALFLDPKCSVSSAATLKVGHLSYWAGSTDVPANSICTTPLAPGASAIAPRVVYVVTSAIRL